MNNKTKIMLGIRIILLIVLLVFFFVFNTTNKTDCQTCSFEIDGKEYNAEEFFNMYADRCLIKHRALPSFNLSLG